MNNLFELNLLCDSADEIATYTLGSHFHSKIEPERRSSSLLVPFGMVAVARLEGVVHCKLARTSPVPKKRLLSIWARTLSNPYLRPSILFPIMFISVFHPVFGVAPLPQSHLEDSIPRQHLWTKLYIHNLSTFAW
jgi:hypothetical protein